MVRDDPRRVVFAGSLGRNAGLIEMPVDRSGDGSLVGHKNWLGKRAVLGVAIQFHLDEVGRETPQVDLDFELQLVTVPFYLHVATSQVLPAFVDLLEPAVQGPARGFVGSRPQRKRGRKVNVLCVLPDHAVATELWRELHHAGPDAADPRLGDAFGVPLVKGRNNLLLDEPVQLLGLPGIPLARVLFCAADCPTDLCREGFIPPPIQDRDVDASVGEHLHAAGPARLRRPARIVEPYVDAGGHLVAQHHVVILKKHDPIHGPRAGATNSLTALTRLLPISSFGCALPAMTICSGRVGWFRRRINRSGSCNRSVGRL